MAGLTSTAGCSAILGGSEGSTGSIAVSSKSFTEQKILGYLTVESLKANTEVEVNDKVGLGGSVTNFEALKNGESDLYWEYTGTSWATLPPKHDEVITDSEKIYNNVKDEFEEEYGITLLERSPFNNTYVLLTRKKWAEEQGISSLSDFGTWVKDGNTDETVVMNAEFEQREDGWPGVTEHYGFSDAAKKLNVKNVGSSLTYKVVGNEQAVLGSGFNTNPKILKFDLTSLEDDQGFFPVYNPAPMTRQEILDENPEIEEPLNEIANSLSTDNIRSLNQKVSIQGKDARTVAKNYLKSEGIV
ncbi:ABC transporter substrate-binding protein [Halorussus salinisoli]|uniref:ABC transporter substrate-binding protein n=1 Tax=Halorussus salinisoli TaxID=2558242 RepID=UPI0010C1B86F|nr:glycine betaine ABC transporter substrate-binding protein [Halorussus salinisoli]